MSIKKFHSLILSIIIIAIYGLFGVKEKVSIFDYQLSIVLKQISQEDNNIHILKAAKAYLESPDRLRQLSKVYLTLQTIKSSQIIKDPLASDDTKYVKFDYNILRSANKWRYKRGVNSKYVQTISSR